MENYNSSQLKKIITQITDLSENEKKEVFKILDKHNVKYTENSNGIYIIISQVPSSILTEVEVFLNFCQKNRETLDSMDNAQMNEKEKIFGNDDQEEMENDIGNLSVDNKYTTNITFQNELDKYGLNLKENDEETDVNLIQPKPKISGIKAKIIKTGNKKN